MGSPLMDIVGGGVNAVGKLMAGQSASQMDLIQAQAYGNQADTAKLNEGLFDTQADIAGMGVDFAASKEKAALGQIATQGRATLSAQRSYFAGGNLDPTFGSPLVVQAVTAGRITTDMNLTKAQFAIDEANSLSTEANIRGQAAGSASQALNSLLGEQSAKLKSSSDLMAGYFGAATALLGAASSAAQSGSFNMPTLDLTSAGFNPIRGISGQ